MDPRVIDMHKKPNQSSDVSTLADARVHEIYLSPHLDDVILSCGGRIAKQTRTGKTVIVVTVNSGDPPEESLSSLALFAHRYWGLAEKPVKHRRAEDIAACDVSGAQFIHWPILDCIYSEHCTTGKPLYKSSLELVGPIHPAEDRLSEIEMLMKTLPTVNQVFAPLAIGNHVDHQLTRLAAERTYPKQLSYYEDYPYSTNAEAAAFFCALGASLSSEIFIFSHTDLQMKICAIEKYLSQIPAIFGSVLAVRDQVCAQAQALGGERYWRRRPEPCVET